MTDSPVASTHRFTPRWATLAVLAVFGLFYAYDVWEAVQNIVNISAVYTAFGLQAADVPWWLLIVAILIPVLAFVLAYVLGRRRALLGQALILLVGLALVAVLSLDVIALEQSIRVGLLTSL